MQLGCLLLGLTFAASSSSHDGLEAVRSVLRRTEGAKAASDEVLVRRLVALGPSAAAPLFTLVTGEGVEALLVPDDAPASWLCPPDHLGALALGALAELPSEPVLDVLRAREATKPERSVRVCELQVLGAQHNARMLPLYFQLLDAFGDELEMRSVRAPAQDALVAILRSDLQSFRALEKNVGGLPLAAQLIVCEALGSSARPEACALLKTLVGHGLELDLSVLGGMAQLAELYPWRLSDDVAPALRDYLASKEPELRGAAARALGRLRDPLAIPALIEHLGDGERSVARTAQWALCECAGRKDLTTADDWKRWLESERTWWRERGSTLLARLDPEQAGVLLDALRELLAHPMVGGQVAEQLSTFLERLEPELQLVVCRTLVQLGSRACVPALIERLSSSDARVREAAWEALRTLTGADLPAEPRLWEEYAFG